MEEKGTAQTEGPYCIVGGCPVRIDVPGFKHSFPCARKPHRDDRHEVRRVDGRILIVAERPQTRVSVLDQIPFSLPPREGRDPARIDDALYVLRQVWMRWPDLRLAQLVIAAAQMGSGSKNADPFYVEDDIVVAQLRKLRDQE